MEPVKTQRALGDEKHTKFGILLAKPSLNCPKEMVGSGSYAAPHHYRLRQTPAMFAPSRTQRAEMERYQIILCCVVFWKPDKLCGGMARSYQEYPAVYIHSDVLLWIHTQLA